MKSIYKYKSASWVDLTIPTDEDVRDVAQEFSLDKQIADDLLSPTIRHTVSFTKDHAYMVLHFPIFKDHADEDAAYELDFVVGKDHIITAHYRKLPLLEEFGADLERFAVEAHDARNSLFFGLLGVLLSDIDSKLSKIDHWVRV
jgi:Mg2+ and Co2+ transporter CorA